MPPPPRRAIVAVMEPRPAIRPARPEDLPAAAALLAAMLGFAAADAVPAWLMRTSGECGGITLVAVAAEAVVGALHSIPGRDDDGAFLFTCGLAVAPSHRGRRLGRDLKLEQRRRARGAGYERIRWTADPVNGRALRVYLSGLGARLTGYRAGLYDGLRADPGHAQDDVDVVWRLGGAPPVGDGDRQAVELPWSSPRPVDRRRVRDQMTALLAGGYVGTDVELDRAARRCRVSFRLPCPPTTS